MAIKLVNEVREKKPLIHNLTNEVVMNFSANGLLAFGGSPIMAVAEEDSADIAKISNGVLINIGTLTEPHLRAMILAGKAANENGVPVVIDPVGVAATAYRTEAFERIVSEVQPTAIKGNVGEMAHLVGISLETKGVDSIGEGDPQEIAREVAAKYTTIAIVTGEVDVVSDGEEIMTNEAGHEWLAKVTGSGCLLGSIVAACLSTSGTPLEQAYAAVRFYGLAAEKASRHTNVNGPGTFAVRFIDALSMDLTKLEEG
ncbi:hydroxyethylthiazole kinase [Halobacillus andaensis]|uniref:Hydroxyethylthiazole kinase n=1 Tax=Halobacillus andaensis TaxID=1176239 RepID=A0A917B3U4_HALAA|nr:hydroxyethylthiazole kinase [Halobacillus andaensis]MBP2004670.1 hydroxyethylthiazole kinase [Halobacillus andaensis]GGF19843.1 hydroxyethylthiazole kinase [Halobacillus andaensis]